MAEWQYVIQHIELDPGDAFDEQLTSALSEYGKKGWELAEILPKDEAARAYRLILKCAKPLD
jgi:hypothetical protein